MPNSGINRPCKRCKTQDAPYRLRADPTCGDCYAQFVSVKMGKRLGRLHNETRASRQLSTRRYLAGLSFGPSSTVLAELLNANGERHSHKKGSSPFNPLVVHVDTDLTAGEDSPARELIEKYRARFPHVEFECVPLTHALGVKSIDWSLLPLATEGESAEANSAVRLQQLFDALPTVTSRADVLRQLIRHVLLDVAIKRSCSAMLLGHSTTALAALTLSEVANGRGFAVPWQVNDGLCSIYTYSPQDPSGAEPAAQGSNQFEFPIYYPMREVFRNEIIQYIGIVPSLQDLVPANQMAVGGGSCVVSHKDLSIEEVMTRYFDGVEDAYSGVVANVVRTTGKLERVAGNDFCGSCGMILDELGDSTWAGEIGDNPVGVQLRPEVRGRLCYGCTRSIHG